MFFIPTLLWFFNMRLHTLFMPWLPLMVPAMLFFADVLTSLFMRPFAYTGIILFRAALVIIAIMAGLSLLCRFKGIGVLIPGSVFWGRKSDYVKRPAADMKRIWNRRITCFTCTTYRIFDTDVKIH